MNDKMTIGEVVGMIVVIGLMLALFAGVVYGGYLAWQERGEEDVFTRARREYNELLPHVEAMSEADRELYIGVIEQATWNRTWTREKFMIVHHLWEKYVGSKL